MENEKKERMIRGCNFASGLSKFILILMCIFLVSYTYYLVRVIFTPESSFSSQIYDDGSTYISNDSATVTCGSTIPQWILPNINPSTEFSLKNLQIVFLLVSIFLMLIPTIVILISLKKIFSSIEMNQSPFTNTTVNSIKLIGWIVIINALIFKDLASIIVALTVFKDIPNTYGKFDLLSILMGAVIIGLAKIFEYGMYLQKEHDETL